MAFKLESSRVAADGERGVIIRFSPAFHDVTDHVFFVYKDQSISFEFDTVSEQEYVSQTEEEIKAAGYRAKRSTGRLIIEASVKYGLLRALKGGALSDSAYHEFKKIILEGMYCLSTQGGSYLKSVPDFNVYFI